MTCHCVEQNPFQPMDDPDERGFLAQRTRQDDRALNPGNRVFRKARGER